MPTTFPKPIVLTAQELTILNVGQTLLRDRTQNQERADGTDAGFDEFGLREDYSGTGYVDLNGSQGDKLSFTFEAEPGTYQVTMRAAASSVREVLLRTEDGTETAANGPATIGDNWPWDLVTFEITVGGTPDVVSSHTVVVEQTTGQGPNIDAIAVGNVGQEASFFEPTLAEAMFEIIENETVIGQIAATDGDDAGAVTTSITGGADAAQFELSATGELSFTTAPDFEANGSAAGTNTYEVEVTADDGIDQSARIVTVEVTDDPEVVEPVTDQRFADGEAGIIAPASGAASLHRVQGDPASAEGPANREGNSPLDAFGLRPGYTGTGYTDFNGSDESVSWTVEVDEAGAYDLHVRFASTDNPGDLRPLDVSVGGGDAQRLTFEGQGFETWVEREPVKVVLEAGTNTVTMAIPQGFSNGPNVDAIAITTVGAAPDFAAPTFDAQVGDVSTAENATGAVADLGASTTDGDEVTYALEGPDAAAFEIDAAGALSFVGAPDFEGPTDAGGDNVYDVTVAATADGPTARQSLSVTVTDVTDEGPTAITLSPVAVAENEDGAIVATIAIDGGTPSAEELIPSDAATFRVIDTGTGLALALQPDVSLDVEADAQPSTTVSLGALTSDAFSPAPADVDEAPTLALSPVTVDENAEAAIVATIDVADPDADAAYAAGDFSVDDGRFEVVAEDGGFVLALRAGEALDFEAGAPTVTVTLAGVSASVVPDVSDLIENLSITFDETTVTAYDTGQDRPNQGGAGVVVSEGGEAITLDGNLWKRAPVPSFTIDEDTVLRVTIDVETVGEAVGIGFDLDDDPFDGDATVYQIAGPQTVRRFVDARTDASTNGTGEFTFEIDLSAHAGTTVQSLVLVADDDRNSDGLGRVTFSDVEISVSDPAANSDPRVVGQGVADFVIDEGSDLEVDLPFVDDDSDPLTYTLTVTKDGSEVTDFPATIDGNVLSGPLGDTAPGVYEITVTADDGQGGTPASDTFTIEVENVNEAPVADPDAAFEPYFGAVGQELDSISLADFAGAFSDPDGEVPTLSAVGLPAGLVFDADEGVIFGTPTEAGDGTFTVVATDAEGLTASIEVALDIDAPGLGDAITIEAEDFTGLDAGSTGFFATGQGGASGDRLIRTNPNVDASVETVLSEGGVTPGWYTVAITVYDETDGEAAFSLSVGGVELTADGASYSDDGTFTNPEASRGNAGQLGNRKTISFTQEIYVDEGTVLSLTGRSDGELLRTDSVTLTRVEMPNAAPEAPVLVADAVAENVVGAAVGTLSAVDPDGDDAAVTFEVDPASPFEVVGDELRLKADESLDFEAGASVAVEVTAVDAAGGRTSATLTVSVADVDEAPAAITLDGAGVAENAPGAVIGLLNAIDPEDGTVTFTVSDPRFVVEGATLRLADGVTLDHEEAESVSVEVTASDGANAAAQVFDVAVTDENDAPELAGGATVAPVAADFGVESRTDLTVLGATDEDAGDAPTYGVRGANGAALPAGISVDGTELVVAETVATGTYAVEVFATDGALESESVPVTVTVGDAPPFQPVTIQLENRDGSITIIDDTGAGEGDAKSTQFRDASNNEGNDNGGKVDGLWPGFNGAGYLDMGGDVGDAFAFDVTVPEAGEYTFAFRYNNGSDFNGGVRPLDVSVGGTVQATPDFARNGSAWTDWQVETATLTLDAGSNTIQVANTVANGPNIDQVTVALPVDDSADADDLLLNLDGPADEVPAGQVSSIDFIATGIDSDVETVEISFDGGATRIDVTALLSAEGEVSVDGTGLAAGPQVATLFVTDLAGNVASQTFAFTVEDEGGVAFDPVTIQGEDAVITDTVGTAGPAATVALTEGQSDSFGNEVGVERTGALGDPQGYLDYGQNPGDSAAFTINVPAAGTYTATFRFANGSDGDRPLDLTVNGGTAQSVSFAGAPANVPDGTDAWNIWREVTVELQLGEGDNVVSLAIPAGGDNGPNVDQVTFAAVDGGEVEAVRFEDVIAVNFEAPLNGNGNNNAPSGYETPDGFESDTGAAYGDRGNGFTYGWVDVDDADGSVTGTPAPQPTGSMRYKNAASEASDLQKTYAHFDYPGAQGDRERAWEMEVENGTYELSVAIGDTAGQYDSDYVLNVEGVQFGEDWEPVNLAGEKVVGGAYDSSDDGVGFRSTVHTGIVQVTDGRLTIDGTDGDNVEIQWLDLQKVPDLTPNDGRTADLDFSKFVAAVAASTEDGQVPIEIGENGELPLDINPTADIVVGVDLQAIDHRGPDVNFTDGVKLVETLTGEEVPITVQVTGGSDGLTISPVGDLKEFTSYTLRIEDVLDLGNLFDADAPVRQFQDYSTSFVTGEAPEVVAREVAFTDTLVLDGFADGGVAITSLEIGPEDGKLYASSITGTIQRWDLNSDGTLDKAGVQTLALDYFQDSGRSIIGMAFDPEDPNVIWVTDNAPVPTSGKAQEIDDFSGRLSKITLGDGGDFATATAETYLTGLPRSGGDHVTNSIEFRANPDAGSAGEPDFLLYFMQGSNTAAGRPDNAWGFRPERLLNAAALEVDHTRDAPNGGFDVQTEPYQAGVNVPTYRDPNAVFEANGTVDGFYDPFADDAVLKIFGEGIRNGYDLVWHSNGNLYVPTNGTARGGNTLDDPTTPNVNEQLSGLDKQYDYLFQVQEGGYYGHPNDLLGNYVVNGGADGVDNVYSGTAGDNAANTSDGGNEYDGGVVADADYDADGAYSLDFNKSPNGAIEYRSDLFGENLQGAVMFVQFSQGDNVRYVTVDPDTGRITGDEILRRPDGSEIDEWLDPLDIIENPATGQLYMVTLNRGSGESKIVLLNPAPGGTVGDVTADEGGDLAIAVDASDPALAGVTITGADDDLDALTVTLTDGTNTVTQPATGNGTFTVDLSALSGSVTATLDVVDGEGNVAQSSTVFSTGGTGAVLIDAATFTNLDAGATIIRDIDDPSTYEEPNSNNDVAPKDGLNDGYDGEGYVDMGGGAEDKASFTFDAPAAGTYELSFRMASNSDRSVAIKTGDQSVGIDVNTTQFTNWTDFPVTLTLEEGANTIVIAQTSAAGPNVDSVTITPLALVDDTADEGGDLAVSAVDIGNATAAEFTVSGADPDLVSLTVVFTDGTDSVSVALPAQGGFNGPFTADLSALGADVTAVATASDGTQSATATAAFTLGTGVPNDGTETVGGRTFVIYEAENASLDGPVVVTEDRTQSGDFVDFDGTTDQSVTWTVSVAEDGDYAVDVIYALSTGKDARPMTLSVDGTALPDPLPFAPNSADTEDDWGPQSTSVFLTAGTHTITVTAPGANGPNLDYLRISQAPVDRPLDLTADEGGDLALSVIDQTDASAVVFEITGLDADIDEVQVAFGGGTPVTVTPDANGQFTADAGISFGIVDAVLTVSDPAGNVADASASFSVAPDGNPNADIAVQSLDPTFFDDRLHFSFLEDDNAVTQKDGNAVGPRDFKDSATVRISNTGTEDLSFADAQVTGPFVLADPAVLDGLTLSGGAFVDVEVLFDGDAVSPKPNNGQNGVQEGALTIVTNDAEDPIVTVDLAGFWQARDEGGWEPNVNEVWELFGFGNFIEGLALNGGGENSELNFFDMYIAEDETEVLSPYWELAEGVTEATITQIAAFHGPGGASMGIHAPGNKNDATGFGSHEGTDNQTILPTRGNGSFFSSTFDAGDIEDGWAGNGIFGFKVANVSSDPTINDTGGGFPTQSQLDAKYPGQFTLTGGTVLDADGNEVPDGYTLRMFQAVDADGEVIDNVFLGAMDYTGINYDYNDNMFVVEGVAPVFFGGSVSVSGLDDAAADDRLVFTNIEQPSGKAGFPQEFRDEATFTITNDGIGALDVTGLSIGGSDAASFEIVGAAPTEIAVGGSADVTVRYVGIDGVDDGAAVLHQATLTVETSAGDTQIALGGLAQLQSESGEEPTVAQIVEAFGYSTDVAQGQLNGGGDVETVGDEVLMPYLERLDGSKPVEVINLAAFLQQGDVSRLNVHELDDDGLTELFAGDEQQGQTVLPDGLVVGAGDTGSVGRTSLDRDAPFGLKVTVDGRPTFAAWTDPEANVADPELGVDDEGHYIRFFQAKDGAGNDIPGTFIGIQDYPGGGNFDYNDAMFLVTNVQPHVLTAANDANDNGVNDALETDADDDGTVAFFDGDDSPATPDVQTASSAAGTPWAVGDGLTLQAAQYDDGGQGVAYNDDPGLDGGTTGGRPGSDVEVTPLGDVGWIEPGEWLEYTVNVGAAGTYDLDLLMATNGGAGRSATVTFTAAGADIPYASTGQVANPVTGGWTTFAERSTTVDLEAGEQVVRILFEGGSQDIRSFTLTPQEAPTNQQPTTTGIAGVPEATEGEAFAFDVSGFFDDPDAGDVLTFTADLPAGLTISDAGVISGTPQSDGDVAITVTASDGQASVSSGFTLAVDEAPAGAVQSPFGGTAPTIGADAVFIDAGTFDEGGQGLSWNDDPGLNGTQSSRTDTDVELVGAQEDIGYVEAGEWVEYTVNVAEAGTYDLSVNAKTPIGGNTVTVSIEGGSPLATFALPDSNGGSTGFGGTTFAETPVQQVTLGAGEQVLRVAFDGAPADNGYLLDYHGLTLDLVEDAGGPEAIGEAGSLSVAQSGPGAWTPVSFSQELDNPSVVIGPLTSNDGSPAVARVRNVTDTGFEVQIDEWDYLDGAHGLETINWIALEAGTHEIGGQTVVAGSGSATGNDAALSFGSDAFDGAPLVFAQVASDQEANAVVAQVNSVSAGGFVLDLDRQELDQRDLGLAHGTETVDWIAVEGGGHVEGGSFSGLVTNVTTTGKGVSLPVAGADTDEFVFLADMQEEAGIDTASTRLKSVADGGWTLFIEEETSRDGELNHALEDVGYFGIELGLIFEDISIV